MEKLDHHHIVKQARTYCLRNCELYLLLWPVAVWELDSLFNDIDALRLGQGDREDAIRHLGALPSSGPQRDRGRQRHASLSPGTAFRQPEYLRRITGMRRAPSRCRWRKHSGREVAPTGSEDNLALPRSIGGQDADTDCADSTSNLRTYFTNPEDSDLSRGLGHRERRSRAPRPHYMTFGAQEHPRSGALRRSAGWRIESP